MSSNVLKYNVVAIKEGDKRVIDTNELIVEKLEKIQEKMNSKALEEAETAGFVQGLEAKQVDILLPEEQSEEQNALSAEPVYEEGTSPDELIAKAVQEIEEMKARAETEIEALKRSAMEEGKNQGYQEGYEQALAEVNQQLAVKEQELHTKEQGMKAMYEQKMEELEPALAETFTGIYEHIFHVGLADYKETIMYLLMNVLHNLDGSRDFIVHLSKEDYPFVTMNRQQIASNIPANATLEFVEDAMVSKNGCMIETGGGIFDCGVDTQLQELTKQIKLLSYEKVQ